LIEIEAAFGLSSKQVTYDPLKSGYAENHSNKFDTFEL
jgi:hypothetical protein